MARDRDEIPTGKVRRATSTTAALGPSGAKLAGSMITSMVRSPERAREVLEQRHIELADNALAVLGTLRGGAMKIGQLADDGRMAFLDFGNTTTVSAEWRDNAAAAAGGFRWERSRVLDSDGQPRLRPPPRSTRRRADVQAGGGDRRLVSA